MRLLKELYLTFFTIFFRIACDAWSPEVNAGKGAAGVALVESLLLVAAGAWIEMLVGIRLLPHFPKWVIFVGVLALSVANYYPLVVYRRGIAFEKEFTHLNKSRKILLLASCFAILVSVIVFCLYSGFAYRRFTGTP